MSDNDMLRMQQEAIRRVRQMQQRAARNVTGEAPPSPEQEAAPAQESAPAPRAAGNAPPEGARPDAPHPGGTQGGPRPGNPHPNGQGQAHPPQTGSLLGSIGNSLGLQGLGEKLGSLGEKLGIGGKGEGGNIITSIVGEDSPIAKVLEALNIDNERLILIGLLLVLLNEKADKTLLIALVYLLL